MAELDTTNPMAVIVGFFALLFTALMIMVKGAMAGGVIGLVVGLGLFFKIMVGKD